MSTNQLTNGRLLRIKAGKVNQPVVEDIENEDFMKSSIFGTQYTQMLSCLDNYVKNRNNGEKQYRNQKTDSPNNVFTFVGERGSGKTSCMSSISKLLTSGKINSFSSYAELKDVKFTTIDIIDPSYFDKRHNIVAMMVAKLYKKYKELDEAQESTVCNRCCRDELLDAFVRTQRSMRCLLGNDGHIQDYESDDIENLSELSVAVDLKEDINKLVNQFLKFAKKDNGILILSIDDIDLNVDEADTMAEQIRKYLVNPNIIILLAAKLSQLATIKNLHYAEQYKPLLADKRIDYETIEEMTSQFMTKFAPHDQRVFMPATDVYFNSKIQIEKENWYGDSVMQVVPELIFNRTRYLFYNSKQTPSFIIPRNLRKLCQLVAMLWPMKEYNGHEQDANKEAFRNYLFGSWVQDNLPQRDRRLVAKLLDGWKNDQLNRTTLDILYDKYRDWIEIKQNEEPGNFDHSMDTREELKSLFDDRNREFNLSVGDVMSFIEVLEVPFESHADKCFFFIVKTIYSMAIYEAYDKLTEKLDKPKEQKVDAVGEVEQQKNQALLYDPFEDEEIEAYHKLVGGRFYNYRLSPVLPKEGSMISRNDRMISYKELDAQIARVVSGWTASKDDKGHVPAEKIGQLKSSVRLCEFFMLCCIRDINLRNSSKNKPDYYDTAFRQATTVCYNGDYTGNQWLYFDLGAFFFNTTRIERCYQRYRDNGKNLLMLCLNDEDGISLYATFMKKALGYRKEYTNPHAWLSWACIRNVEVLSDLDKYLHSHCRLSDGGNIQQLVRYFDTISKYNIKTYDRDSKGAKYNINFEFASDISQLLKNEDVAEKFSAIYEEWSGSVLSGNLTSQLELGDIDVSYVDIDKLLSRRNKNKNKKDSIRKYLRENEGNGIKEFQLFIEAVLSSYGEYLTREEVRNVGNALNLMLYSKYGNAKGNPQDIVSQPESQTDTGESEK